MVNRRKFLLNTGAFAIGSLILPVACTQPTGETGSTSENTGTTGTTGTNGKGNLGPIGLQLYSIRDVLEQDLKGNLKQLAEMGYEEVESYPGKEGHYFGMSPEAFSKMISDVGMKLVSSHVSSGAPATEQVDWRKATLSQNFDALAEQAAKTGQQYLTCSYLHESYRQNLDGLKRTAELFNKSGQICKKYGLQFAYHNHAFEFEKVGNNVIYDYMINNTDPELVKFELDMYWVQRAGQNIEEYLNKYPNRFPLGHVKDMSKNDETQNAVIGEGVIDYKQILKVAKEKGMKHFFIEQETYTLSSMESMRKNIEYLSSLTV